VAIDLVATEILDEVWEATGRREDEAAVLDAGI
jgi:hypothetical protein